MNTIRENVNWCRQQGGSLKNLKIQLPHDPAIPLLGLYPEKTNSKRCMPTSVHNSTVVNIQTWVRSLKWEDSPGEGKGYSLQPGEFHGPYSPWVAKLCPTEQLSLTHLKYSLYIILMLVGWQFRIRPCCFLSFSIMFLVLSAFSQQEQPSCNASEMG